MTSGYQIMGHTIEWRRIYNIYKYLLSAHLDEVQQPLLDVRECCQR